MSELSFCLGPREPIGASRCTRCLVTIPSEDLDEFLRKNHLCRECSKQPFDSAHSQALIQAELATTERNQMP